MKVVIGVDSGGSTTRALVVTLDGERVGYTETGSGNPAHDTASGKNVRLAIERVAKRCGFGNVVRVVAG
ncbi:ATPase, partial [bacterium]